MLNSKRYLKVLFVILGFISAMAIAYGYYFAKHYPLPLTNRISFDAKLKFIRDHVNINEIDTIIVGSSLALNNVQGAYLEKESHVCKKVLNLAVFEASTFQVEQLLELIDIFPNVKRIIYSGQFSDFQFGSIFKDYKPELLKKYISNKLNIIEYSKLVFDTSKNIFFCLNRQKEWAEKYQVQNKFSSLRYDNTGSAPLHIYGKDIVASRWGKAHGDLQNPKSFQVLDRISKKAYKKGIHFYFIQQPYRQPVIDKYKRLQRVIVSFPKRVKKILDRNHGKLLNLYEKLHLSDAYFADRSHLNDKGSLVTTEEIAKFIDEQEK